MACQRRKEIMTKMIEMMKVEVNNGTHVKRELIDTIDLTNDHESASQVPAAVETPPILAKLENGDEIIAVETVAADDEEPKSSQDSNKTLIIDTGDVDSEENEAEMDDAAVQELLEVEMTESVNTDQRPNADVSTTTTSIAVQTSEPDDGERKKV